MKNILILTEHLSAEHVADAIEFLSAAGFSVSSANVAKSNVAEIDVQILNEYSAVIGAVKEGDTRLLLYLAFMIGNGRAPWLLCDEVDSLPSLFDHLPIFPLSGIEGVENLSAQLQEALGIEIPSREDTKDARTFLAWLYEEPNRISSLPQQDFERLVHLVFTAIGLNHSKTDPDEGIFTTPDGNMRMLLQCKAHEKNHRVSIGTVEKLASFAMARDCAFTVLITPNSLTRAASEFAKFCAPPVRVWDAEAIKQALYFILENKKEGVKSKSGWHASQRQHTETFFNEVLRKQRAREFIRVRFQSHSSPSDLREAYIRKAFRTVKEIAGDIKKEHPVIFLNSCASSTIADIYEEMAQEMISLGCLLYHNSPDIAVGERCLDMAHIALAMQKSDQILCVLDSFDDVSHVPYSNYCTSLQIITTLCADRPRDIEKVVLIGKDNIWSRLSLPDMFIDRAIHDPSENDWKSAILDLHAEKFNTNVVSLPPNE